MATIKSFTDISQSKKLAEILPLESADMIWANDNDVIVVPYDLVTRENVLSDFIPCWSLAALINIIPQEIFDGEYIINITEGKDYKWIITYDHCESGQSFYGLSTDADNLVDACTNIIIKLKERNII